MRYSSLVSSLERVEDHLVSGRMDMDASPDDASGSRVSEWVPASGSGRGTGGSSPATDEGRRHYVGCIGLQDVQHHEAILDWRASLARVFYQVMASGPVGLMRRRHIDTWARRVLGVEDEVPDLAALETDEGPSGSLGVSVAARDLQDEEALIATISSARDGRTGDIVAMIQVE